MASILDRYGIKEVADVTFYEINADGTPGNPVLFLDTLKVSTIEQTAEQADARGGKGNPKLITWDYGKEITVTIEDALFSSKSMAVMLGNGTVAADGTATRQVSRTAVVRATDSALPSYFVGDVEDSNSSKGGAVRTKIWMGDPTKVPSDAVTYADATTRGLVITKVFDELGNEIKVSNASISSLAAWSSAAATAGNKYFVEYEVTANGKEIVVSGDSFPGTYYVTGDTYARSDVSGADQFFQFIIPKAKVSAEQTITLQAEGDPATFNMNLTVLRPEDGNMMKLVQYDIAAG